MARGIFITFEGGEGAGKSTLIDQLSRHFKEALKIREPGGTPLGEKLRKLLLESKEPVSPYAELAMFLASRAQHVEEVIGPALQAGKMVLCDRFNDSTIAYQGFARGLGVEKVTQFCAFASQGLTPDLTLYLDIDPTIGLQRAKSARAQDRMEMETIQFHQHIREAFLAIRRAEPSRIRLIDATLPPDVVFHQALKAIESCLKTS